MPVNSSGAISIGGSTSGQSIALELGLSATGTLSMSQLYRGGTYVKPGISNTRNTGVPSSGAISLSNLYGMVRRPTININFSSSTSYTQQTVTTSGSNVTVTSLPASSGYIAGQTDINITIPSTTTIYSNSTASAALTFSAFSSGDEILLDNYGLISGQGGGGGGSSAAGAGGDAINYNPASAAFYPYNRSGGTIAGGGGGGGGGMASQTQYPASPSGTWYDYNRGGGGGGGAGTSGGAGGGTRGSIAVGAGPQYMNYLGSAGAGGSGGTTSGGGGGAGDSGYTFSAWYPLSNYALIYAGSGGSGGSRGASGNSGTQSYFNGPQGVQYFPSNGSAISHSYFGTAWYGYAQSGLTPQSGGAAGNAIRGTAKHGQALQNSGTVLGPQVSS